MTRKNCDIQQTVIRLTLDIHKKLAFGFHSLNLRNSHHTLVSPSLVERSVSQGQNVAV